MKFTDALKQFQQKQLKQLILFTGEEEYLKSMGVAAALSALHIELPEMNFSVFEDRPDTSAVAMAMEMLPLMSENRVVLIKNTDILGTACAAEYTQALVPVQLPQSNCLIISTRGKADKRKALYKRIAKEGMIVECGKPSENELAAFAVNTAQKHGLVLSQTNARLLGEYCDGDIGAVSGELEKLAAVCSGNISAVDIEKYVARSMQYNVFRIHDMLCAGKVAEAKTHVDRLLLDDPNPIGFLSLISGNFRQMLVARACREAKFTQAKTIACIVEETGAKEWNAKRAYTSCAAFATQRLRASLHTLGRMDFMAKQGEIVLKTDLFPLLVQLYSKN